MASSRSIWRARRFFGRPDESHHCDATMLVAEGELLRAIAASLPLPLLRLICVDCSYAMGAAYSQDFRDRVLAEIDEGTPVSEASELYRVSVSFIYKLQARRVATGHTAPCAIRSRPPRKLAAHIEELRGYVTRHNDATLHELQEWLRGRGVTIHIGALWNTLAREQFRYKKRFTPLNGSMTMSQRNEPHGRTGNRPASSLGWSFWMKRRRHAPSMPCGKPLDGSSAPSQPRNAPIILKMPDIYSHDESALAIVILRRENQTCLGSKLLKKKLPLLHSIHSPCQMFFPDLWNSTALNAEWDLDGLRPIMVVYHD